jgi:hypothetical protein
VRPHAASTEKHRQSAGFQISVCKFTLILRRFYNQQSR